MFSQGFITQQEITPWRSGRNHGSVGCLKTILPMTMEKPMGHGWKN